MITTNLVFLFCLVVALSPLGKIRLGGAEAKPEYSYLTWLAMLFAAGVGIGLLFFGVSEPVTYFQGDSGVVKYSPLGTETVYEAKAIYNAKDIPAIDDPAYDPEADYSVKDVPDISDPKVKTAASLSIATTVFHWGLQGWAIYGVVGLALAFYAYNVGSHFSSDPRFILYLVIEYGGGPDTSLTRLLYLQVFLDWQPPSD